MFVTIGLTLERELESQGLASWMAFVEALLVRATATEISSMNASASARVGPSAHRAVKYAGDERAFTL